METWESIENGYDEMREMYDFYRSEWKTWIKRRGNRVNSCGERKTLDLERNDFFHGENNDKKVKQNL